MAASFSSPPPSSSPSTTVVALSAAGGAPPSIATPIPAGIAGAAAGSDPMRSREEKKEEKEEQKSDMGSTKLANLQTDLARLINLVNTIDFTGLIEEEKEERKNNPLPAGRAPTPAEKKPVSLLGKIDRPILHELFATSFADRAASEIQKRRTSIWMSRAEKLFAKIDQISELKKRLELIKPKISTAENKDALQEQKRIEEEIERLEIEEKKNPQLENLRRDHKKAMSELKHPLAELVVRERKVIVAEEKKRVFLETVGTKISDFLGTTTYKFIEFIDNFVKFDSRIRAYIEAGYAVFCDKLDNEAINGEQQLQCLHILLSSLSTDIPKFASQLEKLICYMKSLGVDEAFTTHLAGTFHAATNAVIQNPLIKPLGFDQLAVYQSTKEKLETAKSAEKKALDEEKERNRGRATAVVEDIYRYKKTMLAEGPRHALVEFKNMTDDEFSKKIISAKRLGLFSELHERFNKEQKEQRNEGLTKIMTEAYQLFLSEGRAKAIAEKKETKLAPSEAVVRLPFYQEMSDEEFKSAIHLTVQEGLFFELERKFEAELHGEIARITRTSGTSISVEEQKKKKDRDTEIFEAMRAGLLCALDRSSAPEDALVFSGVDVVLPTKREIIILQTAVQYVKAQELVDFKTVEALQKWTSTAIADHAKQIYEKAVKIGLCSDARSSHPESEYPKIFLSQSELLTKALSNPASYKKSVSPEKKEIAMYELFIQQALKHPDLLLAIVKLQILETAQKSIELSSVFSVHKLYNYRKIVVDSAVSLDMKNEIDSVFSSMRSIMPIPLKAGLLPGIFSARTTMSAPMLATKCLQFLQEGLAPSRENVAAGARRGSVPEMPPAFVRRESLSAAVTASPLPPAAGPGRR